MEKLNEDFRAFIELLESEGVEYLVVGGYAIALNGSQPAAVKHRWMQESTPR